MEEHASPEKSVIGLSLRPQSALSVKSEISHLSFIGISILLSDGGVRAVRVDEGPL